MTNPIHHCKECIDLLGDYIEGVLSPERSKALEDHLSFCPPCIAFVRTYRATRRLCKKHLATEMPRELVASLSSFLEKHVPGFPCSQADSAPPTPVAAADTTPKKV